MALSRFLLAGMWMTNSNGSNWRFTMMVVVMSCILAGCQNPRSRMAAERREQNIRHTGELLEEFDSYRDEHLNRALDWFADIESRRATNLRNLGEEVESLEESREIHRPWVRERIDVWFKDGVRGDRQSIEEFWHLMVE